MRPAEPKPLLPHPALLATAGRSLEAAELPACPSALRPCPTTAGAPAVVSSSSSSQVSTSQSPSISSLSSLPFTTSCSAVVVEVDVFVVMLAKRLKTIQTSMLTDHPSKNDFGGRYILQVHWGSLQQLKTRPACADTPAPTVC